MFGLFQRGKKPKPTLYTVWSDNQTRWERAVGDALSQRAADEVQLFIAHFDETLEELDQALLACDAKTHLISTEHSPADLVRLPAGVYRVRAALLKNDAEPSSMICDRPVRMTAVELHFLPEPDIELHQIAGALDGQIAFTHHVSLDDVFLSLFVGQNTVNLLQRTGFKHGDSIQSPMVNKAIFRAQAKCKETLDVTGLMLEREQLQSIDAVCAALNEAKTIINR